MAMIQPDRVVRHSKVHFRRASAIVATVVLAASIVMAGAPPVRSATGQAFVRVNQIGYATTSTAKRAYLMATAAAATETRAPWRHPSASTHTPVKAR